MSRDWDLTPLAKERRSTERIARSQLGAAEEASQREISLTVEGRRVAADLLHSFGGRELLLRALRIWVKTRWKKKNRTRASTSWRLRG